MASNYSYMNNSTGGTNYSQQQSGQQALAAVRNGSTAMSDPQPSPGASLSQGGGEGITAPARTYTTGGAPLTQYGPTYQGSLYTPAGTPNPSENMFGYMGAMTGGNQSLPTPMTASGDYNPYPAAQQQASSLFPMTPFSGFSNDENFFRNRDNQTILQNWMSMLPYYQTGIQTAQNARDFGEDVRRYNIDTNWTQNMDLQNLGLASQDRQLNWAGLNEGARQFNEQLPLQWAAQDTNQYGASTDRMVGMGNVSNAATRNANDLRLGLGGLANDQFANQTQRMVGMGGVQNEATAIRNSYAIDQEKNRIAQLAAQGVIDNNTATQEFNRLELAQRNIWEMGGLSNQYLDITGGQQIQREQMSLQDVINQRQMALEYARLAQQQTAANAQMYGRFATPNTSRTRRNF